MLRSDGKPVFVLDGSKFTDLAGFYDEVSRSLIPGVMWGRNLDAFSDVLSGGFKTPEEGFMLRWIHSNESHSRLGYSATVEYLEQRLQNCHPSNVPFVQAKLEAARRMEGPTLFDTLVSIIRDHGPCGMRVGDGVVLELI